MQNELTNPQQADQLIDSDQPVWLFKHSISCPISAGANRQFRTYIEDHPDDTAGVVIVQTHRPVSDHIAQRLGVQHQTPQLFLVRNGETLWHTSHGQITAKAMEQARQQHA